MDSRVPDVALVETPGGKLQSLSMSIARLVVTWRGLAGRVPVVSVLPSLCKSMEKSGTVSGGSGSGAQFRRFGAEVSALLSTDRQRSYAARSSRLGSEQLSAFVHCLVHCF
jgi:hypothetical protein